ncbi:MAG TPA: DUF1801 domain-containing protein [Candidatus Limnocylindrales bacterium]|nr:DUF1801 domain-containing protein [Candidatus Limnocylindrales bacterium]
MAMSIREATTPEAYLAALDEPRRSDIATIHERVRQVAPSLTPGAERGFLTYGRYRYRYASGRAGEWFCLGIASNKQYISVYAPPTIDLEPLVARLPKANLGRGCIRFKRVADVDLGVLDEVIRAAADADGRELVSEKASEA